MTRQPRRPVGATAAHRGQPAPLSAIMLACAIALASAAAPMHAQAQDADASAALSAQRQLRLPAQPLGQTLNALAREWGVAISVDATLAAGKTAPALQGATTLQQALRQALAGSGLAAVPRGSAIVVVRTEDGATLAPVTVTATADTYASTLPPAYAGGQVARGARVGMLGNVELMDAPFSVTAYTEQTISDRQSATVGEVLRNDASVRFTTSDGHNAENFTVRGFDINSSEVALNGMYGLLPNTHVPTEFVERVEVFKGPSAMLSGMSPSGSVGGVINVVPKRAGDEPLTRVTASWTGQSKLSTAVDVGRRFGEEQRLGVRVNGSVTDGETTLEDQKKKERFGALGLDYRGDRWKVELDVYAANQDQSNGSPLMVGFGTLGHVLKAPDASKNALRGTFADQESKGVALRGEAQLNDQWTAYAALGGSRYEYDGYINGTRVVVQNDAGNATGQTYNQAGFSRSVSAETGLRGRFTTGTVAHSVTAGLSSLQTRSGLATAVTSASYTTNIYDPIATPTLAGAHAGAVKTADNTATGLALIDTLAVWDDQLQLTLGARAQRVRQSIASPRPYDKDAVTPLAGIVVKPWGPSVSLYANYIEGLSPGVTVGSTYANEGDTLAPYKTKQAEMGVKWETGSFTNTLSVFRIEKPSTVAVASGTSTKSTLVLDGEQRNTGVEWSIFGELAPSVRVLGGAAYIDAKQVRAALAANDGKQVAGVPKTTANVGLEWDTPWVRGLTLEGRATYTSTQYLDAANKLELPAWHRFDLGVRYKTRILGKAVAFRGSVENVTDKAYWSGRFGDGYATLGAPRTFKLSTSVDF